MYRQLRLILVLALVVLFAGGCKKWFEDEELTLPKTPYTGDELRTDGYYYNMEDGKIWSTYFFYRNGVLLYGAGTDTLDDNLDKYDEWFVQDHSNAIFKKESS